MESYRFTEHEKIYRYSELATVKENQTEKLKFFYMSDNITYLNSGNLAC